MAGNTKAVAKIFKTKAPLRKVTAEDLVMEGGEGPYYPHYDESVWFAGKPTVGDQLLFLELSEKYSNTEATEANAEAMFAQFTLVCDVLSRAIKKWDWTDNDENSYPENPSLDDIKSLTMEEVSWLMSAYSGAPAPEERKKE